VRRAITRRSVLRALAATPAVLPFTLGRAAAHNGINHSPQTHEIAISGFAFDPDVLVAKPGDTVRWTNHDIAPHTATAVDGSWDTGPIAGGASAQITVNADMHLDYFCRFHPIMNGSLKLEELR